MKATTKKNARNSLSIKKGAVSANVDFAYFNGVHALTDATIAINNSLLKGAASFCEIAYTLKEVEVNDLTANTEYKNVTDYAEKVFGFKHAQTSNYIKLAKRFLIANKEESKLSFNSTVGNNHFSVSQLTETLTLPEKVANEMIEAGTINDQQTIKQIREIVKAKKAELKGEDTEDTPNEADANKDIADANEEVETVNSETEDATSEARTIEKAFTFLYSILEDYIKKLETIDSDIAKKDLKMCDVALKDLNISYNVIATALTGNNVLSLYAFEMETAQKGF
mgnify:CR=1 FL=1